LTLSAGNTYSGATTISGGILNLGGTAGSLSTSSAITNNAVLSIARTNSVVQGTDFTGAAISGTGGVRAIGTGLHLTLNTANSYQGATTIGTLQNNSVVRATASGALGSGTIQFDTAGNASTARLELSGGITLSNAAIGLAGRGGSSAAIQNITGNNTLSGNIGLQSGGTNYVAQSDSGELTLSGGIANASGTGTRTFTVAGDGNGLLSGSITNGTGTTALTKAGIGTWAISGTDNSYTGATLVSAGTLLVNGSLGNTTVSVGNDATIGGTGSLAGGLAFDAGGLLDVVDLNDPLAVSGTITFGSGFGIANLTGINWGSLDLNTSYTIISTNQTFSASDIGNFGIDNAALVGGGRSAYFNNGSLAIVVIPEPSATLLGGIGMLFLLRRRR
jgi:autotransporter-associated beta strand protein